MFEWDEAKSEKNKAERGFGFDIAYDFDFANAVMVPDRRKDYGEDRFHLVGRIDGAAYMMIFTPRGRNTRIISLRRMHEKEAKRYGI